MSLSFSTARGGVFYQETFGIPPTGVSADLSATNFNWQRFDSNGAEITTGGTAAGVNYSVAGRLVNVTNVNAGPDSDGTFNAYTNGILYFAATPTPSLGLTTEYSFDPNDYVAGSIVFNWYEGNALAAQTFRVIVRIGGVWYASTNTYTSAAVALANFGTAAELKTFTYDAAAGKWQVLNFNGDYILGPTPGTGTTVNSSLGAVTLGAAPVADLSGPITGFGVYGDNGGSASSGNRRIDTFAVSATLIPLLGKAVSWTGASNGNWSTNDINWLNLGNPTNFVQGDTVTFNDSVTGATNVNLTTTVLPGRLTINNSATNYLFTGAGQLSGTATLVKQGTGRLTLANIGNNNYTGGTLISGGTLQVGNADATGNLPVNPITNNASLVFNRSDAVTVASAISGTGTLTKNGNGTLTLSGLNSYTGLTIVNSGALMLNGINSGSAISNAAGTTLGGNGTNAGAVHVSGLVSPGTGPGTLTFNGNVTLYVGATAAFDLNTDTTVGGGVNDLLQVGGNLNLNNNSITVNLLGTPQLGSPYRLINYAGAKSGSFNSSVVVANGRYTASLDQLTANQINLTLSGSGPGSLKWNSAANGTWNVGGAANWINQSTSISPDVYYDGDTVLFDDSASVTNITLAANLAPNNMTVDNTTRLYTFAGPGGLNGTMSLTKTGTGALVLDGSGSNNFSGGTIISAGTVRVGGANNGGGLGSGPVQNDGALIFGGTNNFTVPGDVSGAGGITKNGNGTLTLSGNNSFAAGLTVNGGAVRLTSTSAPGSGQLLVNSGSTLVVGATIGVPLTLSNATLGSVGFGTANGTALTTTDITNAPGTTNIVVTGDPQNFGGASVDVKITGTLHGGGTIVVMANQPNPDGAAGFRLQGTGDSDFNGTIIFSNAVKGEVQTSQAGPFSPAGSAKIVMIAGTYNGSGGNYSEFNLRNSSGGNTIVGNNVEIVGSGLADINGPTAVAGLSTTLGNLKIGGGQILGVNKNTMSVIFQSVTLTGGNATFSPNTPGFVGAGAATLTLGSINESISGSGIIKDGTNSLTLIGTNIFTGNTTINLGTLALVGDTALTNSPLITAASGATLDVSARNDGTLTLVSGQTLLGAGSITGALSANSGSTVSPGSSIGTLTVSGNVTLAGITRMKIDRANSTNDVLASASTITYGGTLIVTNLGGSFAGGESYQLFNSSAASYLGSFSSVQLPPLPSGLSWNTNQLAVTGTISITGSVASKPAITSVFQSGSNLIISGNNGVAGGPYHVLASTNLVQSVATWIPISTNNYASDGRFTNSININPAVSRQFYIISQ